MCASPLFFFESPIPLDFLSFYSPKARQLPEGPLDFLSLWEARYVESLYCSPNCYGLSSMQLRMCSVHVSKDPQAQTRSGGIL